MNTRTFLIADSRSQRRYTIQSSATTLGELQDQMTAQGIDHSGLEITEGLSHTRLIDRASIIPTGMQPKVYNGVSYDAVMLLTNGTKNIASGAYPTNRKEFGDYIKKNNLGDKIKQQFGDNWTRVSTGSLLGFFAAQANTAPAKTKENKQQLEEVRKDLSAGQTVECQQELPAESILPCIKEAPHAATVEWFYDGIKTMATTNLLFPEDVVVLASLTTELAQHLMEIKPELTDSDINKMISTL